MMHQTKHSHLLKLLKDIIKNQIFLGKLIIDKSEILLRTNIFNSIKFLRDTNCEIKSLPVDLELGDNNFIGDLIKLGFNFEKINAIFNTLISSVKVDLTLVKELSGYDKILRQSQYQIDQYNFFYKIELEKYITEKNNEEFIESMKQSKFLLVLAMKHLYPENEIKEFWRF